MKRWMLFAGWAHYPDGGMDDFRGDYNTLAECMTNLEEFEWWNVVDLKTKCVFHSFQRISQPSRLEWAQKIDAQEE